GGRSLRLTEEALAGEPEADAAFTTTPGVVLAILTADCLPILIRADDGSEVAAVHAGWRGLAAGVIADCPARLRPPGRRLLAWPGPALGQAAYEVGGDVHEVLVAHDPAAAAAFVQTRAGHWRCDLYALARQRLAALGITQTYGGGIDPFSGPRFYSHR